MIRGGLSSVSYRNAAPKAVIELARSAGLSGIEWSADTHAPHGDFIRAEELMMATLRAGLTVTSYGSFYRLGKADDDEKQFALILETTRRLQAPAIRIWAPASTDNTSIAVMVKNGNRIADEAGKYGITVCLEPHEKSRISDYKALIEIAETANHPFFKVCWTQLPTRQGDGLLEATRRLAPQIALAHIRNWTQSYDRKPLGQEDPCWTAIEGMAEYNRNSVLDRWAVMEYLIDEMPETLKTEAAALKARIDIQTRSAP